MYVGPHRISSRTLKIYKGVACAHNQTYLAPEAPPTAIVKAHAKNLRVLFSQSFLRIDHMLKVNEFISWALTESESGRMRWQMSLKNHGWATYVVLASLDREDQSSVVCCARKFCHFTRSNYYYDKYAPLPISSEIAIIHICPIVSPGIDTHACRSRLKSIYASRPS